MHQSSSGMAVATALRCRASLREWALLAIVAGELCLQAVEKLAGGAHSHSVVHTAS